jgi:hypothetical protein
MTHIYNEAAYASATRARIISNAMKTFAATYAADFQDIMEFLSTGEVYSYGGCSYKDNFAGNLAHAYFTYGKLTERQVAAVLKCVATQKERKAEWAAKDAEKAATAEYVGVVGKRSEFTLTVKWVVAIDGVYGTSYLHICEDAAGNSVTYKGTAHFADKDETVTCVATVKDHGVYKGKKQTIIQRPKLVNTEALAA